MTKALTSSRPTGASLKTLARALMGRALGFRDCPDAVLDQLAAMGELRTLKQGEYLARRGDANQHVHMLVQGVIESSSLRPDGHRHLFGLMLPGDFAALMSLVDRHAYSHDLLARAPSVVLCLPAEGMRALRGQANSLVLACEQQIVTRTRLLFERVSADPGVPLETRLAGMLQTLAQLYGRRVGETVEFEMKLSQTDLADWLGLSRQRVNFALRQFEADGLLSLHYSRLVILQPDGLKRRSAA